MRWWMLLVVFGGCTGSGSVVLPSDEACGEHKTTLQDEGLVDRLAGQISKVQADLALAGVAASVSAPDGVWMGAQGAADVSSGVVLGPNDLFRIGSVTKMFTATLALQLLDEGMLSLDDELETWVPGRWQGHGITVRHLLNNTSGIVSYNYVGNFDASRAWTPDELLQWAEDHGEEPSFEPGSQWEYSNTNFVLLGLIVEEASSQSYSAALRERIVNPLGMGSTFFPSDEAVPCYQVRGHDDGWADITDQADLSFGWSAGGIVSNTADLNRFQTALHGGELLSSSTYQEMVTNTVLSDGTSTGYGLGIFVDDDPEYGGVYGHTGGLPGFSTYLYTVRSIDTSLAVAVNQDAADLQETSAYLWAAVLDVTYP